MRIILIPLSIGFACVTGCATVTPSVAKPLPFECTSIHPEVCQLEKQFHILRFEQAEQNAAIDAAERKRRATTEVAATNRG